MQINPRAVPRMRQPATAGAVGWLVATLSLLSFNLTAEASPAAVGSDPRHFPRFDVAATCHTRANYAFAATLGQADADQEFSSCTRREAAMRDLAQTVWALSSARTQTECVDLASGTYARLARCLDPSIPAR